MNNLIQGISLWQFIIAVTTSALAILVGTTLVEILKNIFTSRKKKKNLLTQLTIELEQLEKLISRIKIEYKARTIFPIGFIDLAISELNRIDDNLKRSSILNNIELQKKLFETITDCRALLTDINGGEIMILDTNIPEQERTGRKEYMDNTRPEKNIDLSDISNRLSDLIRDLKK